MFSTGESATVELGMVTRCPSRVRMRVERRPTSSTTPSNSPIFIRSPIWKGRSAKMVTEPKRFFRASWAASANASPPRPSPASSAPMFQCQMFWAMNSSATMTVKTRTALRTMGTSWSSSWVRVRAVHRRSQNSNTSTSRYTPQPTASTAMVWHSFGQNSLRSWAGWTFRFSTLPPRYRPPAKTSMLEGLASDRRIIPRPGSRWRSMRYRPWRASRKEMVLPRAKVASNTPKRVAHCHSALLRNSLAYQATSAAAWVTGWLADWVALVRLGMAKGSSDCPSVLGPNIAFRPGQVTVRAGRGGARENWE